MSKLERGHLKAEVSEQPAGQPFIIETPHARAAVMGTRLEMTVTEAKTRLEVAAGLVHLTRLADGAEVDVAAGQYAVAAEGVKLAALALPERPGHVPETDGPPIVLKKGDYPKPRSHLDGRILFEDNFDGPPVSWAVVMGDPDTGYEAVTTDPERYWAIWNDDMKASVNWIIVNPEAEKSEDPKPFVGIRSLRSIEAKRFVVEARMSFGNIGQAWFPPLEVLTHDSQPLQERERRELLPIAQFSLYRWEFEPAENAQKKGVFLCRHFLNGEFRETTRVTPTSKRLLFSYNQLQMCMDRVVVREMLDEDR
jgi:hypothetical protein